MRATAQNAVTSGQRAADEGKMFEPNDVSERAAVLRHPVLLGFAIGLVAANLRPALASLGPVLGDVQSDLDLGGALAAILTALPVLCLGVFAPVAPTLARRWGMEPVVTLVLVTLTAGLLLRVVAGDGTLFVGTAVAGGAIAVGNVLLPALIKRDFPAHSGIMMGVYTMALSGSAAVAAAITVPIGELGGGGWRVALGAWTVPAALALLLWIPFARGHTPPLGTESPSRSLLRDPLAWQVTVFFGLQSLSFYAVLSWLPSIYRDLGYASAAAGLVLSVSTFVQIPVALLLPRSAIRATDQRAYAAAAALLTAAGLAGVLVAPTAAPYVWAVLLGLGQGASFAVGLTLFVLRSHVPEDTARLSAMAQTFGYVIAASGPFLMGALYGATKSWSVPLMVLLLLLIPQLVTGILAGRSLHVGHRPDLAP